MAEVAYVSSADQDHFNLSEDGSPRVQETNTYVSVLAVNKYRFMDDAYQGCNGFRDGTYLIPHDREMFYRKRKDFSVFKNFVRPITNALVDPVFSEEAPRVVVSGGSDTAGSPIARTFLDDVDGTGTPMQDFMYQTMVKSRLHGVVFTLIDNYAVLTATVAESVLTRTFPYTVRKMAWEVVDAKTDDIGRLLEIWFCEAPRQDKNGNYERARAWTAEYSVMMERNKNAQDTSWYPAEEPIYHNLGVIPVVPSYSVSRNSAHEILPDPPLYDVARLNHLIYNKDSEIRDLERSQAFAILYFQSDLGGNITISNHNAILVPPGGTMAPGYISPDPAILTALVANNLGFMEDLFRSAEQSGVHAVQTTQSSSGVALAWRFWGIDHQLKRTARVATDTEQSIMDILALYTGEEYEYTVDYPTSFGPGDRMQEITALKTIVDMAPPKALKKVVFKKITKLLLSDETEEAQQEVLDEIEAEYEQEQEAPKPVVPEVIQNPEQEEGG